MKKINYTELSLIEFLELVKILRMLYTKEIARKFFEKNIDNFGVFEINKKIVWSKTLKTYIYKTSKD